tara:strand:- start:822 stop:1052 length:231 start_codon:yes stop_codon:yes gene_type:complete
LEFFFSFFGQKKVVFGPLTKNSKIKKLKLFTLTIYRLKYFAKTHENVFFPGQVFSQTVENDHERCIKKRPIFSVTA